MPHSDSGSPIGAMPRPRFRCLENGILPVDNQAKLPQVITLASALAGVAEWQTRWTQNPVYASRCGFKSLLRYYLSDKTLRPESSNQKSDAAVQSLSYGETLIHNGIQISRHPAGRILGSALVRLKCRCPVCVVGALPAGFLHCQAVQDAHGANRDECPAQPLRRVQCLLRHAAGRQDIRKRARCRGSGSGGQKFRCFVV
jgi:hypothetical protein